MALNDPFPTPHKSAARTAASQALLVAPRSTTPRLLRTASAFRCFEMVYRPVQAIDILRLSWSFNVNERWQGVGVV